jgi:lipopolysaccharide export system permease protein
MRACLPGIYFRHVAREMATQTLVVAVVLLAVLVIYQFSFVLGRAADGQIPANTVPQLVLLTLRTNLGVILPFAVLLGVVLALGRLHDDGEITAAEAGGVGRAPLHAAAALVVLPATLLAAWVAFVDGPKAAREAIELRKAALRTAITRGLTPGTFRELGSGITLHFDRLAGDGSLEGVFVQRDLPADGAAAPRVQVIVAERARYRIGETGEAIEVELLDGGNYEGRPGEPGWRVMRFARQFLRLPTREARLPGPPRTDHLDNRVLLSSADPRHRAEWHWRVGWVAAVLVLGVVAVPLGRLPPRQSRFARVPAAVLLFAVHAGLLTSGRTWLERGQMPVWLGLTWVPVAVLLLVALVVTLPRLAARWRRRGAPVTST